MGDLTFGDTIDNWSQKRKAKKSEQAQDLTEGDYYDTTKKKV